MAEITPGAIEREPPLGVVVEHGEHLVDVGTWPQRSVTILARLEDREGRRRLISVVARVTIYEGRLPGACLWQRRQFARLGRNLIPWQAINKWLIRERQRAGGDLPADLAAEALNLRCQQSSDG